MSRELLADYPLDEGRHDEMFAAALEPRAHWKPMLDQLAEEPAERMRERLHTVQRRIRENGVTYNVYADPKGADRPWELDVVPLVVEPAVEESVDVDPLLSVPLALPLPVTEPLAVPVPLTEPLALVGPA